jgi:hypothetical protein
LSYAVWHVHSRDFDSLLGRLALLAHVIKPSFFARIAAVALVACAAFPAGAHALDKQGSAHGGQLGGADQGFALGGSLLFGAAVYNPTYAARPDNTGHALLRFAPHFDVDLIGSRLSIPIDINFFSDRDRSGIGKLGPSEFDIIAGVASTWPIGLTAVEFGVRGEGDFPVDRGTKTQSYVDARTRWMYSIGAFAPSLRDALAGGDIGGSVTLGWFAINPSYAARPDNSGRALLRYGFHASVSYTERFFFAFDATFFTDRLQNAVVPSECDITPELGAQIIGGLTGHLAYERDMPLDRAGIKQHFVLLFLTWDFSIVERPAGPT